MSIPGIPDTNVKLIGRLGVMTQADHNRFVPADALWNLAMAINVYLTLFKKYNAEQLKALELRYWLMAYGGPFVVAFIYIFVETNGRGKIYGSAVVCHDICAIDDRELMS